MADSNADTKPVEAAPFEKLPDEIIEQILTATDPNGFASLILLNRKWRAVSQRSHLYLDHLAQCPTYAPNPSKLPTSDDENLPILRRLFAHEIKRNLFDAYLRPTETTIKLISTSISSSSCPGGEGLQFSTSPRSHHMLAYNSSRMYVIDVCAPVVEVKREFKLVRRPAAACIKDDATLLAVLSTEMQVDVYDLKASPPRRQQSIILDNSPRTIALSPCGSVLAAAYEGGIEVSSLKQNVSPSGQRSVKCDGVDSLIFSFDGTQILGTTTQSSPPSTVILTAPYYDPGSLLADDDISSMWTTSILFPNSSRDCSHAVLLQNGIEEEACWTFAYDRSFETFRAVRIDDLRNGTTYFTGPVPNSDSQAKLLPSTLPGTTYHGDLVSAGFHGGEVWVYGVPVDLDAPPPEPVATHGDRGSTASYLGRRNSEQSSLSRNASSRGRENDGLRSPQWTMLYDKLRNTFRAGSKVSEVPGVSAVRWVAGHGSTGLQERLIVSARGVSGPRLATEEEDIDFVDGGRLVLLDFDYGLQDGTKKEITIELGTANAELLEEEQRDMATEVAIVRRRTVAQQRGGRTALLRAATLSPGGLDVPVPPLPQDENADDDDPLLPRRRGQNPALEHSTPDASDDPDVATIEEQEAMDAPYAHANPRSAPTLRRAATAAAVNRTLNPRTADGRPIEYRRADGRREHPHESDADNWVPPPPPYQKEDPQDLPAFLSGPAIAAPTSPFPPPPPIPTRFNLYDSRMPQVRGDRRSLHVDPGRLGEPQRPQMEPRSFSSHHQRTASDSTTHTRSRDRVDDLTRPRSSPSPYVEMDDLYDVSPPESPRPTPQEEPVQSEQPIQPPSEPTSDPPAARISPEDSYSYPDFNNDTAPSPHVVSPRHVTTSPDVEADVPPHVAESTLQPQIAEAAPTVRRLSNAQTWPLGPGGDASQVWQNHQPEASMSQVPANDYLPRIPPLPSSDQLDSLNKRISRGNPRRLSGSLHDAGSSNQGGYFNQGPSPTWPIRPVTVGPSHNWDRGIDQPLIISTPTGVSGAFDPPQQQSSNNWGGAPILAPVPRHPRPMRGVYSPRPTVERLETIYSTAEQSIHQAAPPQRAPTRSRRKIFSALRRSPSTSPPSSMPAGVMRHPSRAERSAAKNIQDAKSKGWNPRRSKSKKKKKHGNRDYDVASTAGWTDVSIPSVKKEKKCLVM